MKDFFQQDRLLWSVLARLARRGYVTSPDEGRELMRSFYVEAWPKVLRDFDKRKASLQTYLARAFYLFSRRRIVQETNWRHRLADMTNVLDTSPEPKAAAERHEEIESVRKALESLPDKERSVLVDFLSGYTRERDLAQKHGMTRHRLRETLVEALGRIATRLGALTSIEDQVARKLWYEGRTVRDTGRLLKLTTAEVQAHRNELTARFLRSIRRLNASTSKEPSMNSGLKLLKDVLLSGDEQALAQLKKEAEQVRNALDENDLELSETERKALRPAWTARVFEALAGSDDVTAREKSISAAIESLHEEEDAEIGRAFAESLVPTLPKEFRNWDVWFKGVSKALAGHQDFLRNTKVVCHGMPFAAGLVLYGLTPATFFEAAHGIQLLTDRLFQTALGPTDGVQAQPDLEQLFLWVRSRAESGDPLSVNIDLKNEKDETARLPCVPRSLLISQVQATPDCPKEAAAPLLAWMVKAAQFKPFFFPGYQSETLDEDSVRLIQEVVSHEEEELAYRWGRCAQEVGELVGV